MAALSRRKGLVALLAVVVAGALIAVLLLLVAGPATAKEFATLHVLEGTVEVKRAGQEAFGPGAEGDTLRSGDSVRTGSDGRAEIEYFDGSFTRLDFETTFVLTELASIPDEPNSKIIEARQDSGRTFQRVLEITGAESRFDVETPTATASVRGTDFVVFENDDGSIEVWVIPDDDPTTTSIVVIILADGTEVPVEEGQGARITDDGVDTFTLTEEQLSDAWLDFNCDVLGTDIPACEEPEVLGEVIEEEPEEEEEQQQENQDQQPPPDDDTTEVLGGTTTPSPSPKPKKDQDPQPPPSDGSPVTITLTWSTGPADLDLHVLTPDTDEAEGGEAWSGNPCVEKPGGGCHATATGNASGGGSETVTLKPIDQPDPNNWPPGAYQVWVENVSCVDNTFETSDATVTVSRPGSGAVSLSVGGAAGDKKGQTWNVASVFMTQRGAMATTGTQQVVGDPCGPTPSPRTTTTTTTSGRLMNGPPAPAASTGNDAEVVGQAGAESTEGPGDRSGNHGGEQSGGTPEGPAPEPPAPPPTPPEPEEPVAPEPPPVPPESPEPPVPAPVPEPPLVPDPGSGGEPLS